MTHPPKCWLRRVWPPLCILNIVGFVRRSKWCLTAEVATNFIELLHTSPAPCGFIGNNFESKLEPYTASTNLSRSARSQPAVKIRSFHLCVEHLSRSFCPGCFRVRVYSQVNPTSCHFTQSPTSFLKPFYCFFLRMNWNLCELLSPDRCLPHWEA